MSKKKEKTETLQAPETEEVQVVETESTAKRVLNVVVNVVLVVAVAVAALCTYTSYVASSGNGVPSILGVRMFSIQTESMYPTLLPGDLVFDTAVKEAEDLRPGDIITYWTVINGERVLNTHRIEEVYDGGGYLIFSTKGDNNTTADPLTVHESEVVGKYSMRIKGLGKFFDYLQTSTGFLIVVVVPVFLFFLFHLVQFFRVLFEYQNVKNRIKYEQERGRTEDLIEDQKAKQQEAQANARAKMEAELRERLRAEILASMAAQNPSAPKPAEPAPVQQAEPVPASAEPVAVQQPVVEEAPAETAYEEAETVPEETVSEETGVEITEEDSELENILAEFGSTEAVPAEEVPAETEEEPAAVPEQPALDEAAIEALIAKQREAIEAQLREKLRAEMLAGMNQASSDPAAKNEE